MSLQTWIKALVDKFNLFIGSSIEVTPIYMDVPVGCEGSGIYVGKKKIQMRGKEANSILLFMEDEKVYQIVGSLLVPHFDNLDVGTPVKIYCSKQDPRTKQKHFEVMVYFVA